jgi:hypothetical protein
MRNPPRYENYGQYPREWTAWQSRFIWWPEKIEGKTRWLTKVYERHKGKFLYSIDPGDGGIWSIEYQYAFDIFDMMRYENE